MQQQQHQRRPRHRAGPNRPGGWKRPLSLLKELSSRSTSGSSRGIELWAEDESVFRQQLEYLDLSAAAVASEPPRSTIAVAFSTDGKLLASTHGDHTVKITDFLRGRVVQSLQGHPRTPWTVKFHPKDARIVASGCIGSEVRVWNASTGRCLHSVTLEAAIISLSFHPSGRMLAIASSLYVYLWDYNSKARPFIAWAHSHTLRCVRFTPGGGGIIVGAANSSSSSSAPSSQQSQGDSSAAAGGGTRGGAAATATAAAAAAAAISPSRPAEVSFLLQVWDFSLEAALVEDVSAAMTRERVLLSRALLYNDGGFDVSEDGLWLCTIAELRERVVASDRRSLSAGPSLASEPSVPSLASSTTAATAAASPMATLTEVEEEAGREGEAVGKGSAAAAAVAVAAVAAGKRKEQATTEPPGGALGSKKGSGNSDGDTVVAPKNGSHLGKLGLAMPAFVTTAGGVARAEKLTGSTSAVAGPAAAGAGSGSGGGEQHAAGTAAARGREEGAGDQHAGGKRGPVLAPWPSRAGTRSYFSATLAAAAAAAGGAQDVIMGEVRSNADACGVESTVAAEEAAASATLRPETGGNNDPPPFTPPPFTPSPRITLKRRLSGSWLSASSGGGRRSAGGGSGGFWGRDLRRGVSPRIGSAEGAGGAGAEGATQQQEGDRPPPLPPPMPPMLGVSGRGLLASSPPSFSTPSPSSFSTVASRHARPPPPPPPPPPAAVAPASSSSSSSSPSLPTGGMRVSLPLLLRPPRRPSSSGRHVAGGATSAGVVRATRTGDGRRQEERHRHLHDQQEGGGAQPLFFLQVPGGGTAAAGASVADLGRREGGGWSTEYLRGGGGGGSADAEGAPPGEPYGGGGGGGGSSRGGGGSEEEQHPGDGGDSVRAEGGAAGWRRDSPNDNNSRNSSGGAHSSFGRRRGRASPSLAVGSQPPRKLVPHLVMVSLDVEGGGGAGSGRAARVVRAEPMDTLNAKQVTSVKLSPSARYILLGVGVRGGGPGGGGGGGGRAARQTRQQQQQQQAAAVPDRQGNAPGAPAIPVPSDRALSSIYRSIDLQPVVR
ncbi:unnamed protein product [Ectocarpus fasciculatus]